MVLADLRQRCTQTATNRRASTSLELAESRLSQELAAHQDQLDETREQMELFTRVQNLQRTAAAKYDALSDVLGGTSPELLRLLDHRNPGPFARMDAADAEIHFVEVIAEIDSELNRHSAKPPANTPVATDAALQQTLTQLQRKCEGGISDGMPLRDMHGEVLNAKQALARDRHRSKNSALPHVRRVKSLWLQAKKALAELSDPHIRTQRQQQLDAMRDLINQALRSAGADASEYS